MILVTAAIIEKNGLILAARRKPGDALAGFWEFPGGKIEAKETAEQCLARELGEEFGVLCEVGDFFAESIYDYGTKIVRLLAYRVQHLSGIFECRAHDRICWLKIDALASLRWAPADIPLVMKLAEDAQVTATLAFYRDSALEYVRQTVDLTGIEPLRRRFVDLLTPQSLILDLGCGSGRDSRFFLELGHHVVAVDPVKEIAACATQYLNQPVIVKKAEEIEEHDTYDGIWACASLLHIPKSRIEASLARIAEALKPGGILAMSFKRGEAERQDQHQRFFNDYTMTTMQSLLRHFPQLKRIELSESMSALRSKQQAWINVLVAKTAKTNHL